MDTAVTPVVPALYSAEFFRNRDPYPTYQKHLEGPVVQSSAMMPNTWLMFRYAACSTHLRDPNLSAARPPKLLVPVPEADLPRFEDLASHLQRWLLMRDQPSHKPLRKLMNKGFSPLTIQQMRPRIELLVERLVDDLRAAPEPDIMRDFAYPLPVRVICELLGVPDALQDRCVVLTDDIAVLLANPHVTTEAAECAQDAVRELAAYFRDIIRDHEDDGEENLLNLLLHIAADDEQQMSEEELLAQCVMLLFAGHETTRNLIGNGVYTLLRHPESLAAVRADPERVKSAVEEVLRFESPLQAVRRVTTAEVEFDGTRIPAGHTVIFVTAAANRDPRQFEDPDRFDIDRRLNRHLAFGADHHVCIGSTLARLEGQIAIDAIMRAFPNLQLLDQTPDWRGHAAMRGFRTLRVGI
ncbi:cytochrome P450 [Burkholderia gladioli]|nr:cytochrome P450 [Burkholderia gladioli]AYQ88436.1 cytochrome P450 [Burkholderia gladioli]